MKNRKLTSENLAEFLNFMKEGLPEMLFCGSPFCNQFLVINIYPACDVCIGIRCKLEKWNVENLSEW